MAKDIGNGHKTVNTVFDLHVTRLQLSSLADFFSFQKLNSVNSDVTVLYRASTALYFTTITLPQSKILKVCAACRAQRLLPL